MSKTNSGQTTIQQGDSFRDLVVSMLDAAGFVCESEVREKFKKVDISCYIEDINGLEKYGIEAKDYSSNLGKSECIEFVSEYGSLVRSRDLDRAWLISRGAVSPDGRALIENEPYLKVMTFEEFQRKLLGLDKYLQELVNSYDADGIADWYVPLRVEDGGLLETVARTWLEEKDGLPLAVVAGYGKGKSTFARHLAVALAREALVDPSKRVPILVPLGEIVDEQSLEGLLGKIFATRSNARGYNFSLFEKLNRAGRFRRDFRRFRRNEARHDPCALRSKCHRVDASG